MASIKEYKDCLKLFLNFIDDPYIDKAFTKKYKRYKSCIQILKDHNASEDIINDMEDPREVAKKLLEEK